MHRLILLLFVCQPVLSQGLFEEAQKEDNPLNIGGYARGVLYLGNDSQTDKADLKSGYGEMGLKISGNLQRYGTFYSEIRARSGNEYGEDISEINVREAYVDLYPGDFEFRMGKQIINWGRADGFNPTNNLCPQDYFVRSPEEDDIRLGNFALTARYNISPNIRFEGIWVPRYSYSLYRFDLFEMPDYVSITESTWPDASLANSSYAARIEYLFNKLDGSFSYFSGFDPMPGIQSGIIDGDPTTDFRLDLFSRAFRQQSIGSDMAFNAGAYGIRTEAAFRMITGDDKGSVYAPADDLRFSIGLDRAFGDLHILMQYMGHYVMDYKPSQSVGELPEIDPLMLQDPSLLPMINNMLESELSGFNQIIHRQTEEFSHSLMIRPALSLFYETLSAEITGIYNYSTEEWNLIPEVRYRMNDNILISLGGQYFQGPQNTVYDMLGPVFNSIYMELRYSF